MKPSDDIVRKADISKCEKYRWTLERRWGDGETICWIMLNPSKADDLKDDPTIKRCIHFSRQWGYGALTVVNLYPFRSSKQNPCRRWSEGAAETKEDSNMLLVNMAIIVREAARSAKVVAAWGGSSWCQDQAEAVLKQLGIVGGLSLYTLKETATGAPFHPKARGKHRIADDAELVHYRTV